MNIQNSFFYAIAVNIEATSQLFSKLKHKLLCLIDIVLLFLKLICQILKKSVVNGLKLLQNE